MLTSPSQHSKSDQAQETIIMHETFVVFGFSADELVIGALEHQLLDHFAFQRRKAEEGLEKSQHFVKFTKIKNAFTAARMRGQFSQTRVEKILIFAINQRIIQRHQTPENPREIEAQAAQFQKKPFNLKNRGHAISTQQKRRKLNRANFREQPTHPTRFFSEHGRESEINCDLLVIFLDAHNATPGENNFAESVQTGFEAFFVGWTRSLEFFEKITEKKEFAEICKSFISSHNPKIFFCGFGPNALISSQIGDEVKNLEFVRFVEFKLEFG